jgi:carbamoyl-phosphate synthase small subunit
MRAFISTQDTDPSSCVERAREIPSMVGQDLVKNVTTHVPYYWRNGQPVLFDDAAIFLDRNVWKFKTYKYSVVAFDYGIKYNILRNLESQGFEIVVVPATTKADTIKAMEPDGIFLSNCPGDPEPVTYAIESIKALLDVAPLFGICLGHQLLGLALGGKTFKLKFGHRGANQPVKNLLTGRIEITSQNHGFAVDTDSLIGEDIEITHINLNDNTLEGFRHKKYPVFTAQFHPEASPGPHDAKYLFDEFKAMIEKKKK